MGDNELAERVSNLAHEIATVKSLDEDRKQKLDRLYEVVVGNGKESALILRQRISEERQRTSIQKMEANERLAEARHREVLAAIHAGFNEAAEDRSRNRARIEEIERKDIGRIGVSRGIIVGLMAGSGTIGALVVKILEALAHSP